MQVPNLIQIKTELEDYKQLLINNNISLIDCTNKIKDIIDSTVCLKEEIKKRCDYFQELYLDIDFFNNVITPLADYTLEKRKLDDMCAFTHKVIIRDFSVNDLKMENWKGYRSDGFEVPTEEDLLLGNVPLEDKKIIEIYKEFLKQTEEIPKSLYLREICYFERLVFCISNNFTNELNQLLSFKDSNTNILAVIRLLVLTCDNVINCTSVKNSENKSTKNINNKKDILIYNKNDLFTLNKKPFLQSRPNLAHALKLIINCDTKNIKIATLRNYVFRIKEEAYSLGIDFELLIFDKNIKQYKISDKITYKDYT